MKKEIKKGVEVENKKRLRKRKLDKIKHEVKKGTILIAIGFIGGLVYYKELIEKPKVVYLEKPIIVDKEKPKEETCGYDETTCKIKKVAEENGIDWKIAVAISKHETGVYTSKAFKELHNVGGMMYWNGKQMALKTFTTTDDGINAFVSNLKKNYFDKGLTTIEQIGNKYCPVGTNDNGLNQYWIPKVTYFYNELNQK